MEVKTRVCLRCDNPVLEEHALDYPYFCSTCDENMFTFETRIAIVDVMDTRHTDNIDISEVLNYYLNNPVLEDKIMQDIHRKASWV